MDTPRTSMMSGHSWLRATAALCVGLIATLAHGAYNQYPFEAPQDYLTVATDFTPWADALSRHESQRAALFSCSEGTKKCRGRLRSFNRMVTKAQGLSAREKVYLVNTYINRTNYDTDHPKRLYDEDGKKIGVTRNQWATLYEFLTDRGDCEDYATAKYFMLRELGVRAEDMKVVVTYERKLRGYHAVLALRLDGGAIWLLESDNQIRKKYHGGYRYVYAMNEYSVWDHRDDY
jgi:predicted transglutaminase-like cysteine proteinase